MYLHATVSSPASLDMAKKSEREAPKEDEEQRRLQREIHALPSFDGDQLTPSEIWWSQHFEWLKHCGYLLRPRYAPDWVPSWKGTKKDSFMCEDSKIPIVPSKIIDATRLSDGAYVTLKIIRPSIHPYEVEIGQYFSSESLRADPANHCVPIYEVIPIHEEECAIIVMPLLRDYTSPPFCTFGEVVECFRQLFEGLQFMHKYRVAHRDCTNVNIMMDASNISIDAFHPVHPLMKRDFSGYARFRKRTQRPPKYYFIDFGLSRRYDPSTIKPLEVPIWGGDKEVPEFQGSNEPRDPFATDVFYIGNAIRIELLEKNRGFEFMQSLIADMIQVDPSKRPTMDEVVERFEGIRQSLTMSKLRSRIVNKQEAMIDSVPRAVLHWTRQLFFFVRRLSPVLPPPSTCIT